ncbi:MAG: hypothetical protein AAGC46_09470 [Solirubrobacteraceae bacterium]
MLGDRIRLGEQLVVVGVIALIVLLPFGSWFELGAPNPDRGLPGGVYVAGTAGAWHLGWFAFAVACLAGLAALVYVVRMFTARSAERVMLQAPVVFAFGLFATLVVLVRMVLLTPGFDETFPIAGPERLSTVHFDGLVTAGGWLGLIALAMIPVGAWIAMYDERTDSLGAVARTAALLRDVEARPVSALPTAVRTPEPAAAVVADDAAADDSVDGPGRLG